MKSGIRIKLVKEFNEKPLIYLYMKKFPFVLATAFTFLISCDEKKDENINSTGLLNQEEIEEIAEEEASQFAGFESNETLKNWLEFYKNAQTPINLSNFTLKPNRKLELKEGHIKANYEPGFDSTYEPFLIYNPSKTMYLDIDSYNWFLDKEGVAQFDADSEINLVNLNDKTVSRIAFYGPSSWVDDAFWMSDSVFVLLENNYENLPSLQVYNLKKKMISTYNYSDSARNRIPTKYLKKRLADKGIKLTP